MEADWDLHAVVRGCGASVTTTSTTCSSTNHVYQSDDNFICFKDFIDTKNDVHGELQHLYKSFVPISPFVIGGLQDLSPHQTLKQHQEIHNHQLNTSLIIQSKQPHKYANNYTSKTSASNGTSHGDNPRIKRRKNQLKRVCEVSAEGLSSDKWSWRKYGQKPIKGSQYPRGYYKCSTLKSCLARKQVDRHRSNPNMYIVTYTSEHNHPTPTHRNSLAGITHQKPVNSQVSSAGDTNTNS